jgi:hypothetical protein
VTAEVAGLVSVRCLQPCSTEDLDELWALYTRAYRAVETKVVTREVLYRDEFDRLLTAPSTMTWVAYSGSRTVAMCPIATDLSVITWLNGDFFAGRFPDRPIRYLAFLVVDSSVRLARVIQSIAGGLIPEAQQANAVLAFDTSTSNNGPALTVLMRRLLRSHGIDREVVPVAERVVVAKDFTNGSGSQPGPHPMRSRKGRV